MTPGAWGAGSEVRCARCGKHPLFQAALVGDEYVCRTCATCSRCRTLGDETYLVGRGERACAHCLTTAEQLAVGHEGTEPEAADD